MSFWFHVEQPEKDPHKDFEQNVTYNVSTMLKRAGFHPIIVNGRTAEELRPVVRHSWQVLTDNPEYFQQFNPDNGWGDYTGVKDFLSNLDTYLMSAPDHFVMRVS